VDENVEFPSVLSELPGLPTHLAVDPKSGDLWFVLFNYGGGTNDLYRYRKSTGKLDTRPVPASGGSEFFSAIAVDSRGHVIIAEGSLVLDVDPDGGYEQLDLPVPENLAVQPGWDGTYVIDMVLSEDGKAYLTRMNTAAITEFDLPSGSVREMPISKDLGQMYFIALAGDSLWMTTWLDTEATASKTAVMDAKTGVAESTGLKTSVIAADSRGQIYVAETAPSGLSRITSDRAAAKLAAEPAALGRGQDFLVAETNGSRIWMAADSSGTIMSRDVTTGKVESYVLPYFSETVDVSVPIACAIFGCGGDKGSVTRLGDIAVAPNGDLYFSDMSYNRIGVVHPR
jgi:streptogramin lyase